MVKCQLLNGDAVDMPKTCVSVGNIRVEMAKWFECVAGDIITITTEGALLRDGDVPPDMVVAVVQKTHYDAETWQRIILLHAECADAEGITRAVQRMATDGVAIQGTSRPFVRFPHRKDTLSTAAARRSRQSAKCWWDDRAERSHAILVNAWFECGADAVALQSLVSAGVPVDVGGLRRRTALHVAAQRGDLQKVQALINIKAQLGVDSCGITPLHDAVIEARTDVVELLLNSGSSVNGANNGGFLNTPLHWACRAGSSTEHTRVVLLLLERKCDINAKNADGKTALHDATSGRRVSLAELLLKHGADANAQTSAGNTPLHFVQWSPTHVQEAMTEMLIKYGADVAIKNKRGESTLYPKPKASNLT